jgi:FKBP-type peptidyl-prolyl cis-trans isomerase SlyD
MFVMELIVNSTIPSLVVADDLVVSLAYKLTVDNEVVDASEEGEPLEFLQGHGEIIPGLEKQVYGLAVGDAKQINVDAADAYGPIDPDALMDVPREQFPTEIPLQIGTVLQVKDSDNEVHNARISKVDARSIQLDFNHPLAGKDLSFAVTVVDLREATAEELEHGHSHGEDYDEEDYEVEEDESL